jgi:hypothetical protein
MTGPGALCVTAGALLFLALVLAFATDATYSHAKGRRYALTGWIVLIASLACFVGAAWWEVTR